MRYLTGVPPCPMVVLCPCGAWHRAPLRATEDYHFALDCGLSAHLTVEQESPFVQFYFGGRVVEIVDLGAGTNHLYVTLEER